MLILRWECNKCEGDRQCLPRDGCWLPGQTSALLLQCANKPHHHSPRDGLSDLHHVSIPAVHDVEVTYDYITYLPGSASTMWSNPFFLSSPRTFFLFTIPLNSWKKLEIETTYEILSNLERRSNHYQRNTPVSQ